MTPTDRGKYQAFLKERIERVKRERIRLDTRERALLEELVEMEGSDD